MHYCSRRSLSRDIFLPETCKVRVQKKIFGRFFFVYADQLQMLHNEVVFADMLIEKPRKPVLRTYQSILIFRMEIFAEKILVCYVKWTSQGH